ncbi:MAG: MBL fold metallo-hydrolase [Oscillospiraceae bacterium]|jgi:hydroxyacylglutathione hydrolase
MQIKTLHVGSYGTNCYILSDEDTKQAAVIDPGDQGGYILKTVSDGGLTVRYILLTHGHFDHTGAVSEVSRATGAPIYIHRGELETRGLMPNGLPPENELNFFNEGDVLNLGSLEIKVLHTPGHSLGSCCFLVGRVLFSGDTLFRDSCGRTDFEGGSWTSMMKSLRRLYELEGDCNVYPGHMRETTLDRERRLNDFMREAVRR